MHSQGLDSCTVLVGAPNSGKTTLYNWLTGSKYKTVNYPGATVDYSKGRTLEIYGDALDTIDTPGIYSLAPKTPEEHVTLNILFDDLKKEDPKVIVAVVDATQFVRQVLLAEQLKQAGFNIVVALTMTDILKQQGKEIDIKQLQGELGLEVVAIDGRLGGNVKDLVTRIHHLEKPKTAIQKIFWDQKKYDQMFAKLETIWKNVCRDKKNRAAKTEDKLTASIDKWALHPILGIFIFVGLMFLIFSSVFWMAAPAIDWVDGIFSFFADTVIAESPDSLFLQFVGNGLIAGVGAFAVFIPQIAILFLGLSLLEDSGYMARAAAIIDKPLAKVGMNGRSFVPILSSFACAVPGMMAARTIPNKRERFLTLFILPLMTCSARLPVYALMLVFLFADQPAWIAGLAMAGLYFASVLIGALTAALINRFLPKPESSFFVLELPAYRYPSPRAVLKTVYEKTYSFASRAGPVILMLSILIWVSSTFPNYDMENERERLTTSYAAQAGRMIEPALLPMGVDWRVGIGMISAFAAREVFVSTLALVFNVDDEDEENISLLSKMRSARFIDSEGNSGAYIFTFPSIMAILVFFMIALQCMATVGVAVKEFGGWWFATLQLVGFNLVAYLFAVLTFQILS